ncbi:MAG: 16S rRNA (guanine(966)-N(2))-methyltransferase RsmD [Pseudomonadota bacterium]
MRIVGGRNKGVTLTSLGRGDAGAHLRPTSDRVRENLFNTLLGGRYGDPVTEARVLDLFAGTGALSFEALSRGAAHATLVDNGRRAQALIRANADRTGNEVTLLRVDATRLPANGDAPFNLIFLDPPYGKGLGAGALAAAQTAGWLAEEALVVWEENARQAAPAGFALEDQRRYGDTHVTILRATT